MPNSRKRKKAKQIPKWKEFERLVADVQRDLAGDALVTSNEEIMGTSGSVRQIDVSIRKQIGQFQLLVILDCKNYKKNIDIKVVEEFEGLVKDVRAHKAAIVTAKGCSDGAKSRARQAGIDIYRLVDTGDHDWKAQLAVPAAITFLGPKGFQLNIRSHSGGPIPQLEEDVRRLMLFDSSGVRMGTVRAILSRKWNEGQIPPEPGTYKGIPLSESPVELRIGGIRCVVTITADVTIERRIYFGHWPLSKVSGFEDQIDGGLATRGLTIDNFSMEEVERMWLRVDDLETLAVRPIVTLFGRDYPSDDDPLN